MVAAASTQSKLSPRSRLLLHGTHGSEKLAPSTMMSAFVTLDDTSDLDELKAAGVSISSVAGNVATVQVPLRAINDVCALPSVRAMQLASRVELTNDSARYYSNVEPVHAGQVYSHPYTGQGVIVGVIDTGVDFNHINLCDSMGRSRVLAAYLPADETGTSPVIDGNTLPGSHYASPDQIASLTTDNGNQSHGTHTTGTAAGSYMGNGMHGVAPDAQLVICSMPDEDLTDVNIANSVKYIFDYADRVGKPAVINMSLGSQEGPHDGTSMLCRFFDEVSGPGRICVVSTANNGSQKMAIDYRFTSATDTLYTCIIPYADYGGRIPGYVTLWSSVATPHKAAFTAVSKSTGKILHTWPIPDNISEDEPLVLSGEDPAFAQSFDASSSIEIVNGVEPCNGHYHTYADIHVTPLNSDIALGIKVGSQQGDRLCMWGGSGLTFTRNGHSYMTTGMKSMSVSDLATGDSAISVGAYCTRNFMPLADGTLRPNSRVTLHDIAYFSGYGPDVRGIARPDVCAPGFSLLSSSNRYDSISTQAHGWKGPSEWVDGIEYTYASHYGTSMSTPVVSGAIALWLQACPQLGPERIKHILKETSQRDKYVTGGDLTRWGAGKLDVAAGLRLLLDEAAVTTLHTHPVSIFPSPGNGNFTIAGIPAGGTHVRVFDAQGRFAAEQRVLASDGMARIDMCDTLTDGLYIVVVSANSGQFTGKLIVKH